MLGGLERNAAGKRKGRKVLLLRHGVGESRFHVRAVSEDAYLERARSAL